MMRRSFLLLPLLALPLLSARSVVFGPSSSSVSVDEDTPLQKAMDALKKGQRAVKKLIADPAANESALLEHLQSMETATLAAFGLKVPAPGGLAGKDLALFELGYKREMVNLLGRVLELREATLRHDAKAAKTAYDALSGSKKTGHDGFRDF